MVLSTWDYLGLRPERWQRWFDLDVTPEGWLRVEEIHEEGTLVVRVELPGVDPDKDLDVLVTDGVLHISAKREEHTEHKDKGKTGYRSEFRYGEFSRDLALPTGVDKDAVNAAYKDGILEVRIPWPAEPGATSTKVPISRS